MKNLKQFNLIFLSILLIAFSTPVHSFGFTLPDTGQELCYDWDKIICDEWHMDGPNQICDSPPYCPSEGEDFYGQDAHYIINPPDLTDNGDGTVSDNLTSLIWEQKTEGNEPDNFTYDDALAYCDDLTLAGNSDWRVSTREEYSTILNYADVSPSLDTDYFPYFLSTGTNPAYYWTSSEYFDDTSQVWVLRLAFGLFDKRLKTPDIYRVRCVRGDTLPAASYTDNGDSTVTDNVAALMWEQKTAGNKSDSYNWKDALAYCEELLLGGHDGWRLPNPKELERSVDLETSSPAVDTTYFPNTNNALYWTGTTCSGCHKMKAFAVDCTDGELYYGNKFRDEVYYENYVRCVRTTDAATTTTTASATTTTTISSQVDISGEWEGTCVSSSSGSTYGTAADLNQSGDIVGGSISVILPFTDPPTEMKGEVEGNVSGYNFTGTWTDTGGTYPDPGDFDFEISIDWNTMSGELLIHTTDRGDITYQDFILERENPVTTTSSSSTTTTTVPTSNISVSPETIPRSRWIPLPAILAIQGNGTNFEQRVSKPTYSPENALFELPALVLNSELIWQMVFVNPTLLCEQGDQTVTVTMDGASGDFVIKLLPLILDEEGNLK